MPMQQWRVLDPRTIQASNDATLRVKLPVSNVLHSLAVLVECTNGATNAQGQTMREVIDWIKVIADGSQVLFYLEPETIRLQHLLDTRENLVETINEGASIVQKAVFPVKFGRDWFDPEYYLDLAMFNDLELQIKFSPTIAATSFTTGTTTTTVIGLMTMAGQPGPYKGSFVTRIIENFTTVASGDKTVKPPQGWPYRSLFVRSYEAGIQDGVDITGVKLDLNNGGVTPLNMTWNQLHNLNQSLKPINPVLSAIIHRADTDTVITLLSHIRSAILTPHHDVSITNDTFTVAGIDTIAGDTLTLNLSEGDITAAGEDLTAETGDLVYFLLVHAEGLPYGVWLPLNVEDKAPYFNSKAYDEIELILTQAAAGGDTDVVLQEVRNFS